jgi:hypothetical protein
VGPAVGERGRRPGIPLRVSCPAGPWASSEAGPNGLPRPLFIIFLCSAISSFLFSVFLISFIGFAF